MATYEPTIQVEAAFGYGALDDAPVWTAIDVVQSGNIRRGRTVEFDNFPSGSCALQLVDDDRSFDPMNSAGSYAGSLLPNVPIRVVASHGGTDYPRFRGFVDAWKVQSRVRDSVVSLTATDGFKILSQKFLPRSVYETVVLADSPYLYWKLDEADGSAAVDASGNEHHGVYITPTVERSAPAVVKYANNGSVRTTGYDYAPVRSDNPATVLQTRPMTVEMWVRCDDPALILPATSASQEQMLFYIPTGAAVTTGLEIHYSFLPPSGSTSLFIRDPGGVNTTVSGLPILHDGAAHHLVFVVETTATTVYLDGVALSATTGFAGSVGRGDNYMFVGIRTGSLDVPYSASTSWLGSIDDFAIYDAALTAAQVAEHYEAGTSPWDGDTTGARIGRILDLVGWPAALRDIDDGEIILGPADLAGVSALAYLQLIAQSEGGRLFIAADGSVTFHGAARLRANTSATATFSDDGSDTPYAYGTGSYVLDDRQVFNEATVQRKYGSPQTAQDTTSSDVYGPRSKELSGLLLQTEAQAQNRAENIVFRYKDPQIRLDGINVEPEVKPANWPTNLALELGDHIAFEIQTAGTLARETLQLDLEQISESFTPSRYQFTYVGSPRDPNVENYLTFGGTLSTQSFGTGVFA